MTTSGQSYERWNDCKLRRLGHTVCWEFSSHHYASILIYNRLAFTFNIDSVKSDKWDWVVIKRVFDSDGMISN